MPPGSSGIPPLESARFSMPPLPSFTDCANCAKQSPPAARSTSSPMKAPSIFVTTGGECATCCASEWRRLHSIFLQGAAAVVLMLDDKDAAREIAQSLIPPRKINQPPAPMIVRRLRICDPEEGV